MIRQLVKLLYPLDVSAHDSFFLLENTDITINLGVAKLIVVKIAKSSGHLVLAFVVKKHMECTCVIVYFELRPHRLLHSSQQAAHEDDVIYRVAIELANIVRARLRIHNHTNSDGGEDLRATRFLPSTTSTGTACTTKAWPIGGCSLLCTLIHIEESVNILSSLDMGRFDQ